MNAPDNNNLERRARALYREASRNVDTATAGRLRAARREALAAANAPAQHRLARVLVPASAFAAVAFAALMMWSPMQQRASSASSSAVAAQTAEVDGDLPPDPTSADPSMVQNLDFYDWLATSDSQASR
ncbi:hypothetical protein SAMN05216570_0032 [Dyella sp. OK004]|uniref:hypothetical protein n=1 Tax=Dyella sp. OK004 TaxID=1855292 RepID=UPI0008E8C3AA|nr:hypothetical protein [Dyella sp. OK004]SFR85557.1 hypothetical protein SAMN05216570_0032 [Dyella sp. OK004]